MSNPDDDLLEAVPTSYAGTDFRSRLEAGWAATLDSWGFRWQYEPETITLPSGAVYIPDFWIPEMRTWLEVKGTGVPRVEKAIELGETRASELVIIGHPPKRYVPGASRYHRDAHGGHPVWTVANGSAWLGRCHRCFRMAWWSRQKCRGCGAPGAGGHAYFSGDLALEFVWAGSPASTLPVMHREGLAEAARREAARRPVDDLEGEAS
jgi:hypothetical protein